MGRWDLWAGKYGTLLVKFPRARARARAHAITHTRTHRHTRTHGHGDWGSVRDTITALINKPAVYIKRSEMFMNIWPTDSTVHSALQSRTCQDWVTPARQERSLLHFRSCAPEGIVYKRPLAAVSVTRWDIYWVTLSILTLSCCSSSVIQAK